MDEIIKEFEKKNFDTRTLDLIVNFIDEFDSLFGKYVPKDEVIRRIKENLDMVEFECDFENKNYKGTYNSKSRKIKLARIEDEEYLKSTFFHEMIHCITSDQDKLVTGFSREINIMDFDEDGEIIKNEMKIITCHGLTEGFTGYVTRKRDKIYAPNIYKNSYPILSEQIENIVEVIGEDTFLDIAFNRPDDIEKELDFDDDFSLKYEFFSAFDTIWKIEDEIYRDKIKGRLIRAIFGDDYVSESNKDEDVIQDKRVIIERLKSILLKRPVKTIEDLNLTYLQISKYAEQLDMNKDIELFEEWLNNVRILQESGIGLEEILSGVTEEAGTLIKGTNLLEEFYRLDKHERLDLFTKDSFYEMLYEDGIYESCFENEICSKLIYGIVQTNSRNDSLSLFYELEHGLAEIIKNRGYNIETLAREYIIFNTSQRFRNGSFMEVDTIMNLYDCNTEKTTFLGSFYFDGERYQELIINKDTEELEKKYPELEKMVVYVTEDGQIIAYCGENRYIQMCEDTHEIVENAKITYTPSYVEQLQWKIKNRLTRIENLISTNALAVIIEFEKSQVEKLVQEIEIIQSNSKILPEEIETATRGISRTIAIEELNHIIEDFTNKDELRKLAFEEEIGYGR